MSRKRKAKETEEYFTDEMGKNVYVFPPSIGDMDGCYRQPSSQKTVKEHLSRVFGGKRVSLVYLNRLSTAIYGEF